MLLEEELEDEDVLGLELEELEVDGLLEDEDDELEDELPDTSITPLFFAMFFAFCRASLELDAVTLCRRPEVSTY